MKSLPGKQRILLLARSLDCGGVERTALTLLEGISSSTHEIHLGFLESSGDFKVSDYARGRLLRPTEGPLESWLENRSGPIVGFLRYLRYSLLMQWWIWRFKPDLVMSMCLESMIAGCFNFKLGASWVGSVGSDNHEVLNREYSGPFRPWLQGLLSLVYNRPDRILTPSRGLKQVMNQEFRVPLDLIEVVPNPVDLEQIQTRALEPLAEDGFLLGVGRFVEVKGFALLIRALAKVPGSDLILLGEGPQRQVLQDLAEELGVSHRLQMPGYVDNPWNYMKRADVVVIPSLAEGFSNVLVEAMAAGACVVTSDCAHGPREIVRDGVEAKVVPVGHVLALAEAITDLLEDPQTCEALRQMAVERSRIYDIKALGSCYLEWMEAAMQEGRVGGCKNPSC